MADGAELKVATVARNKPAQLDFLVPPLAPGEYRLEVRAAIYKTVEIRKGALQAALTVAGTAPLAPS